MPTASCIWLVFLFEEPTKNKGMYFSGRLLNAHSLQYLYLEKPTNKKWMYFAGHFLNAYIHLYLYLMNQQFIFQATRWMPTASCTCICLRRTISYECILLCRPLVECAQPAAQCSWTNGCWEWSGGNVANTAIIITMIITIITATININTIIISTPIYYTVSIKWLSTSPPFQHHEIYIAAIIINLCGGSC